MKNSRFCEYGIAVLAVTVCTIVSFLMFTHSVLINLVMIYLLGTLVVATRGHRGPSALSSALSVLCFDFFFVPPRFSFTIADAKYLFTFGVMFVVAMVISHLTIRLRLEAESAQRGELRTTLMHEFSQLLTRAHGPQEVLSAAIATIEKTFDGTVIPFIPNSLIDTASLSDKEFAVAQWVYDKSEPAGLGADALPSEPALYVPLRGSAGTVGVLRLCPQTGQPLSTQQRQLLDSFGNQIALALEVDRLEETAKKTKLEVETERLRSALLSSVSHDFRTPLTAIVGSTSALLEREELRKNTPALELLETIQEEGNRLSRLVQNLLETTRLESGNVRLRKESYPLEEIIGSGLERLSKTLQGRNVTVTIAENFPVVPMDALLVEQVFINLLENVVRHTPAASSIEISATPEKESALVTVQDHGPGIKKEDLDRVFEKFYHDPASPGAGLGLAICRAVINAHGGRIWAENSPNGGAQFKFTLPLES